MFSIHDPIPLKTCKHHPGSHGFIEEFPHWDPPIGDRQVTGTWFPSRASAGPRPTESTEAGGMEDLGKFWHFSWLLLASICFNGLNLAMLI